MARGDRVLLYAQNCPQYVIAYYAILRADAVVVPVNPMNRTEELRHYVEDSDARVAIAGQDVLREIAPLRLTHVLPIVYSDYLEAATDLPVPEFVRARGRRDWKDAVAAPLAPGPHLASPDDLAVMPYTSGTTGKPKGCMHTHTSVQATTVAYLYWRGAQDQSVVLSALPMFHVTGMQAGMNAPIHTAATLVVLSRWDRDCAGMQIERARVTNWSAITTMLVDFLSNPRLKDYDLSSLRVLGGGGAAMPEALGAAAGGGHRPAVRRRLRPVGDHGAVAHQPAAPPEAAMRRHPVLQHRCAEFSIFRIFHELKPNEVGEIVVHGPQVFQGYWKQPEASAQAFVEHDGKRFFRTGDLGYYDEEGYFFITDRLKRMINCSGYKVWPAEVEAMLYAHPAIQEACVIGSRDAYRGETVKAVVVLKSAVKNIAPKDIIDWARERMAAFKVPRLVEFVDELPKTATGKILWRKLQEEENQK